jgi:trk system potassium uptake protein TrkA
MNVLILGAGQAGASVAAALSREQHDISVIDNDQGRLRELAEKFDLRIVHGHASHPSVLARAGIEDADALIALTSSDEVNIVACEVAHTLYRTPMKIARVRTADYLAHPELFQENHLAVDLFISPELLVTRYVEKLIQYPGALQVLDFADGKAQLVGMRAFSDGALVGHALRTLRQHMPKGADARVVAIFRRGQSIPVDGDTVIEVDDEVFFLAERAHLRAVMNELHRSEKPVKRVMLAGGGNIGRALAMRLEKRYAVKVIERYAERARQIAEELESSIVLTGDCADEDLLREENIDQVDVYCALTNDDEANILSAMLAKRMGARRVVSLVNRPAYAELTERGLVDIAVSPQQVTISAVLAHVRQGNLVKVHSLRRGAAEAIEAVARGDRGGSRVVGRRIEEIRLPPGAAIGGIVRGEQLLIAHHDTLIEAEDHVILFLADKAQLRAVETLFRASALAL